jgi:hypothetical protein
MAQAPAAHAQGRERLLPMTAPTSEASVSSPSLRAGRDVVVRPDDVVLTSYPRSGNTWMRFLLANLIRVGNDAVSFANIESFVPDIYVTTHDELARFASPRVLKSHECFDARYGRVVYLVRDPRDVAASYRAYLVKMNYLADDDPVEPFVGRFIAGDLDSYGTWRHFLIVRYEDLRADPAAELLRVAGFAGLSTDGERIRRAVSASDINTMRRSERETGHLWPPLRGSRADREFARHGRIGGGQHELSSEAVELIEETWRELMSNMGYQREGHSRRLRIRGRGNH